MNKYNNLKRFLKILFDRSKGILVFSVFILTIISTISLFRPQIIRIILDDAIVNKKIDLLMILVILYIAAIAIVVIFRIINEFLYSKLRRKISTKLKLSILKHLQKLSGKYYTNIETGKIINTLENDVSILENFGIDVIFNCFIDLLTITVAIIFLIKIQPDLLLIILLIQGIVIYIQLKSTNMIGKKTKEIQSIKGELVNMAQEYISNIMKVIMSKSKNLFFGNYVKTIRNLAGKQTRFECLVNINFAISGFLGSVIVILIYGIGGIKIMNQEMTLGELVIFQQYVNMILNPCIRLIRTNAMIQQALVSMDRVFAILDTKSTVISVENNLEIEIGFIQIIKFKDVLFSYDKERTLNKINMIFEKGKKTAIVGASGCGKSTLIKLLFRLWDIEEGEITVNKININKYKINSVRKNIAVLTQDVLLLNDTIINNLTLGKKNIEMDYIKILCEKVGILPTINNLEEGFQTIVGENGAKLSGGQKQRIAIVRVLLEKAEILILDEITSALDNISQKQIFDNIKEYLDNKVVIIISHRLSIITSADCIYVMEQGEVIESGCHEELILKKGNYYNLLNT